jgi:hypothetical protein
MLLLLTFRGVLESLRLIRYQGFDRIKVYVLKKKEYAVISVLH